MKLPTGVEETMKKAREKSKFRGKTFDKFGVSNESEKVGEVSTDDIVQSSYQNPDQIYEGIRNRAEAEGVQDIQGDTRYQKVPVLLRDFQPNELGLTTYGGSLRSPQEGSAMSVGEATLSPKWFDKEDPVPGFYRMAGNTGAMLPVLSEEVFHSSMARAQQEVPPKLISSKEGLVETSKTSNDALRESLQRDNLAGDTHVTIKELSPYKAAIPEVRDGLRVLANTIGYHPYEYEGASTDEGQFEKGFQSFLAKLKEFDSKKPTELTEREKATKTTQQPYIDVLLRGSDESKLKMEKILREVYKRFADAGRLPVNTA